MPEWFKNWENTGLIIFDDKNNDGIINYNNSNENELVIDNDIMVLANPCSIFNIWLCPHIEMMVKIGLALNLRW